MRSNRTIWEAPEDTWYLEKDHLGKKGVEGKKAKIGLWDTPNI